MFFLLKTVMGLSATVFLTYTYYESFYPSLSSGLGALIALSALICLLVSAPKTKRKVYSIPFMVFPFFGVYVFTYNFFLFVSALILGIVIALSVRKRKNYTKILFTCDNRPIFLKHRIRRNRMSVFRNVFAVAIAAGLLLGFIFPTPTPPWMVRAFPIDFSQKATLGEDVIPLGDVSSIGWYDENSLLVASFYDIDDSLPSPGKEAGLMEGDIITKINGTTAKESDFIKNGADENEAVLAVKRLEDDGMLHDYAFTVTPIYSEIDKLYRIGITYYTSPTISASVQTLSFVYPSTGYFAATAHSSDNVYEDINSLKGVLFSSVANGRDEDGIIAVPAEIIGESVYTDTYGCYGVMALPEKESIPIAEKHEFSIGKATMLSAFEGNGVQEYEVYIMGTYRVDMRDVLFLIVTDERLIDAGGIARGMSGSPIIQNGRLIGALSNMDEGGYTAYATFSEDMAHSIYTNSDKLTP